MNQIKGIIFIVEAGRNIGLGHFFRSFSLAMYLKDHFSLNFFVPDSIPIINHTLTEAGVPFQNFRNDFVSEPEILLEYIQNDSIVVLDGYNFTPSFQYKIKKKGSKLVCIDDLHKNHFFADYVINQSVGLDPAIYSTEPYTKIVSGLDFILLRPKFAEKISLERKLSNIENLVINMGGIDIHNVSEKIIEAALIASCFHKISVISGSQNPHINQIKNLCSQNSQLFLHEDLNADQLSNLFVDSQLAVLPASTICLEASAVGIGIVSGYTASNQVDNLLGLESEGLILNIGNFLEIGRKELSRVLKEVVCSPETVNKQISNQRRLIDGKANERYLQIFKSL